MEKRRAGEMTTLDTRGESHEKVNKIKRYSQIIECLRENAVMMNEKGYIPTTERNFTAPRLTEMSQLGIVEPIGKKTCKYTKHKVTVYLLRESEAE